MSLERSRWSPLMAITQDGLTATHLEQTRRLLEAGVRWIQLRMKQATAVERETIARTFAGLCREAGAVGIVNDDVSAALSSGADGVHLGATDMGWREARAALGPERILGGTINHLSDAERARREGVLDYAGAGPWRFTANKKNLAPILGRDGVGALVTRLAPLPVWVIGGIEISDMPEIRALGAAGAAVSTALVHQPDLAARVSHFLRSWENAPAFTSSL